jgi:hypothetical protein
MVNGIEDPWRWASIQKSQGNIISVIADCQNCAHCVDLRASTDHDSKNLIEIRNDRMK